MIGRGGKTADRARPLLIAVIAMGVLIVVVTTVVIVKLVKDVVTGGAATGRVTLTTTMLHQPIGSRIVTITAVDGRLGVLLEGGGPDRILFVDPGTGQVAGQLMLGR